MLSYDEINMNNWRKQLLPSISHKEGISKPMENNKIKEIKEMQSSDEIGSDAAEINLSKLNECRKR